MKMVAVHEVTDHNRLLHNSSLQLWYIFHNCYWKIHPLFYSVEKVIWALPGWTIDTNYKSFLFSKIHLNRDGFDIRLEICNYWAVLLGHNPNHISMCHLHSFLDQAWRSQRNVLRSDKTSFRILIIYRRKRRELSNINCHSYLVQTTQVL